MRTIAVFLALVSLTVTSVALHSVWPMVGAAALAVGLAAYNHWKFKEVDM